MAEWPVEIRKHFDFENTGPRDPGNPTWVSPTQQDGELYGYIFCCPRCGEPGDLPAATPRNPANSGKRVWAVTLVEDRLTLEPSILCACGAHYFLTGGILREV